MNTNGGGMSYAHSGSYGMLCMQESIRQVRGEAANQIPGVDIALEPPNPERPYRYARTFIPPSIHPNANCWPPPKDAIEKDEGTVAAEIGCAPMGR
mgnify:CR=1 FL=1